MSEAKRAEIVADATAFLDGLPSEY